MLLLMALILAAALTAALTLRPTPVKLTVNRDAQALSALAEMCLREAVANATRGGSFTEALRLRLTLASPAWGRLTLVDYGYGEGEGYVDAWALIRCEGRGQSFTVKPTAGLKAAATLDARGELTVLTLRVEAEEGRPVGSLEAHLNGAGITLQRVDLYTFKASITRAGSATLTLVDERGIRVSLNLF